MTVERVKAAARQRADRNFIVVDHSTDDSSLSSYIRDDRACLNVFIGALNCAIQTQSPTLRAALLSEIRCLDRGPAEKELETIDELELSIPTDLGSSSVSSKTSAPPSTATSTRIAFERHPEGSVSSPVSDTASAA